MEQFPQVKGISFSWLAALVFLYVVLVGPLDYLFLKHVVRRMELTWVSFSLMVAATAVVAGAWGVASKCPELLLNRVELADVDARSGVCRGTTWLTLYSPQLRRYKLEVRPSHERWFDEPGYQYGGPSVVVSWMGLAEKTIGGLAHTGSFGLFRYGYRYGPDATFLADVPVQVNSMKSFVASWQAKARKIIDCKLESVGTDRLRGTVTNSSGYLLEDVRIVYVRRIYAVGSLAPGQTASVHEHSPVDLYGELSRKGGPFVRNANLAGMPFSRAVDLLFTMMFYSRMPRGLEYPTNEYLAYLDFSEMLSNRTAYLIAKTAEPLTEVFIDGARSQENLHSLHAIRVALPVKPGKIKIEPEWPQSWYK